MKRTVLISILFILIPFCAMAMEPGCGSTNEEISDTVDSDAQVNEEISNLVDSDAQTWGLVAIKADPTNETITTYTVKNVGGGTWNYGHKGNHCWSHYVHPKKRHSATAIQGSVNKKVFKDATIWANADIYDRSGTCYAYWSTY